MNYCGMDVAMKSRHIHITGSSGCKRTAGEVPTEKSAKDRQVVQCSPGNTASGRDYSALAVIEAWQEAVLDPTIIQSVYRALYAKPYS